MNNETTAEYVARIKAEYEAQGEARERARCIRVCVDFAKACYIESEKRAQQGLHDDAKEFTERGHAATAIANDLEKGE